MRSKGRERGKRLVILTGSIVHRSELVTMTVLIRVLYRMSATFDNLPFETTCVDREIFFERKLSKLLFN